MSRVIPALLCDFYKLSHREQYPKGTEVVYSTWTPRSNKYHPSAKKVVAFGAQAFIKEYLIDYFNEHFFSAPVEDVALEYKRFVRATLGIGNPDVKHIIQLHQLGYLPLEIKAIPEGMSVPLRCPMLTIRNTDKRFFWLTNFLETLFSCEMWQASTSATIAKEYRAILDAYAKETGDEGFVQFQGHDFSMRGMGCLGSAVKSGMGHLLSFVGTDTIPAIYGMEAFYNADVTKELVGTSIPATEHSVMCAGGDGVDEFATYKRLINDVYPSGYVSIVSDTWDLWGCIRDIITPLKDSIMARDGKVVIRPDSGDPVEIICGVGSGIPAFDSESDEWNDFFYGLRYNEGRTIQVDGVFYKIDGIQDFIEEYGIDSFYNTKATEMNELISGGRCGVLTPVTIDTTSLSYIGLIEALWNIFGGAVNEKGYKVLDSHIGAIYGDSITLERCKEICKRLKAKGFASTNMVYGIGSFTYQYNTRDTFGFAFKSTMVRVKGKEVMIYKNPKTDDGTKKSNKGVVAVIDDGNGGFRCIDQLSFNNEQPDLMQWIFLDGKLLVDDTLTAVRSRCLSSI